MDAQGLQNKALENTGKPASRAELLAALKRKGVDLSKQSFSTGFDPIKSAMKRHPGLTLEDAEAAAKAFGF
jgi:lambda repressor-like predicted transcriptional regulator